MAKDHEADGPEDEALKSTGENPEREGPGPAWTPTDEPEPDQPDTREPPPEAAPGDSGETSTPRR